MVRHSPVTGRYVTIEVDGMEYKVFYLHNGKGQPLICQHTAGCHNHQWRGLLEDEEITKNYNVIAYDLPRHGKSDPPHNHEWWKEEYKLTKEHYVNFIVALCDALELDDPIFMGSSFGGNVALQLPCASQTDSRLSFRLKRHITRRVSSLIGGGIPMPMPHRFALRVFGI